MSVMAKWKWKTFDVSTKKVNPLSNFSTSSTIKGDNSESKKKNTELVPISFDVNLHSAVGIDPQAEYESWCNLIKKTGVLYFHGKRFGRETRLTKVALSGVQMDDFGRIRYAVLGLTFEEVNKKEVKNDKSAIKASTSKEVKEEKKKKKTKGKKVSIQVGSKVKLTGKLYTDGKAILDSDKKRILTIDKINENKAYLTQVKSWAYLSDLSLA